MSDIKLVSPLLDSFVIGEALNSHNGVTCYPAMKENSEDRYIVKTIAVPASQKQLDALLLTGAYKDPAEATEYFREIAEGIVAEAEILKKLSSLEGFLPYDNWQMTPMGDNKLGYMIYLLGPYRQSLEKYLRRNPMTHLGSVNLGLDLCSALAICRRAGHIFIDLKPGNIYLTNEREYRIGDLGFANLNALKFNSLPSRYCSDYTAPELRDPLATLNPTADIYALGMILYQIYNNGQLPDVQKELPAPANADYELAEIILKACAQNPRNRYQTPIEMGQALVSYMQRNVVNDDPILPPVDVPIVMDAEITELDSAEFDEAEVTEEVQEQVEQIVAEGDASDKEPIVSEEEIPEEQDVQEAAAPEVVETEADVTVEDDEDEDDEFVEPIQKKPHGPKKKLGKRIFSIFLTLLVLGGLAFGGYYYYINYYLQLVEEMNIHGNDTSITVELVTDIDETTLTAICTDMYGNTRKSSVNGGIAQFNELNSGSVYTISLEVEGFHQLTGATSGSFETKELTTLSDFTAKTSSEDGSAVLSFSVDGPDSQEWNLTYSAEGVEPETVTFTGHMVTITGLTIDTTYSFLLEPVNSLYMEGTNSLEFTASKAILAENLTITSLSGTTLTATWSAPADTTVASWIVHCYSDTGYDANFEVTDTTATFTELYGNETYTVEVTAAGMSQSARTLISAKTTSITDISVTKGKNLKVTWNYVGSAPEGGWLLAYDVDGSETKEVVKCDSNSATITNAIPKSTYSLTVQAADGSPIFGGSYSYTVPKAKDFDQYSLPASYIDAYLGKTPAAEKWTHSDVEKTNVFASGESVTMVLNATMKFNGSTENVDITFVIRNSSGQALSELSSSYSKAWNKMWNNFYATLSVPALPTAAGDYTMELYFNGNFVSSNPFSIT